MDYIGKLAREIKKRDNVEQFGIIVGVVADIEENEETGEKKYKLSTQINGSTIIIEDFLILDGVITSLKKKDKIIIMVTSNNQNFVVLNKYDSVVNGIVE